MPGAISASISATSPATSWTRRSRRDPTATSTVTACCIVFRISSGCLAPSRTGSSRAAYCASWCTAATPAPRWKESAPCARSAGIATPEVKGPGGGDGSVRECMRDEMSLTRGSPDASAIPTPPPSSWTNCSRRFRRLRFHSSFCHRAPSRYSSRARTDPQTRGDSLLPDEYKLLCAEGIGGYRSAASLRGGRVDRAQSQASRRGPPALSRLILSSAQVRPRESPSRRENQILPATFYPSPALGVPLGGGPRTRTPLPGPPHSDSYSAVRLPQSRR